MEERPFYHERVAGREDSIVHEWRGAQDTAGNTSSSLVPRPTHKTQAPAYIGSRLSGHLTMPS